MFRLNVSRRGGQGLLAAATVALFIGVGATQMGSAQAAPDQRTPDRPNVGANSRWGTLYVRMQIPDKLTNGSFVCRNLGSDLKSWNFKSLDGPSWAQNKIPAAVAEEAYRRIRPSGDTGDIVKNVVAYPIWRQNRSGSFDEIKCGYTMVFDDLPVDVERRSLTNVSARKKTARQDCLSDPHPSVPGKRVILLKAEDQQNFSVLCTWGVGVSAQMRPGAVGESSTKDVWFVSNGV